MASGWYFFLLLEKQNLVLMKCLTDFLKLFDRYTIRDADAANFGTQIRCEKAHVYV
jgi:hypothetical protein